MQDMDFLKSFHTAAQLLPERLWRAAYLLEEEQRSACEEFRVRQGRPFAATVAGKTVFPGNGQVIPTREELDALLARATECSVHTYLEQLQQGYLTTRHGHRIGVCGEAQTGGQKLMRGLSSVNIRIARQVTELPPPVQSWLKKPFENTLILAPPGAGKTTLLRELCRALSETFRVSVADERYEIAACADGLPRFRIGSCDVLSGGDKRETIPLLLRSMAPQILAVDEITRQEDCACLLDCVGVGCGLLATAHGSRLSDLERRPAYRELLRNGVFRRVILLRREGSERTCTVSELPEQAGRA